MNREPRVRLPLAGILIIFVAPLASLMVIVPSLFAGSVQKVETAVPAIISRLAPNPSPHDHAPRTAGNGLPRVALTKPSTSSSQPSRPSVTTGAAATAQQPAPAPAPSPVTVPTSTTVQVPTTGGHSNHGRRRRRRPHDLLSD